MINFLKKNKDLIKNMLLISCTIVLLFQFTIAFNDLTELIDRNQPYISQEPVVPSQGHIPRAHNLTQGHIDFLDGGIYQGHITYVKTDTLKIFTYKLFQAILLLFGVFMCLIFMAINNKNFSLVELIEEKQE